MTKKAKIMVRLFEESAQGITFKGKTHVLKYRGPQLVPRKIDDKARNALYQARRFSNLLKTELNMDEETSGRLVFDIIIRKIASRLGINLPFEDVPIREAGFKVKRNLEINYNYIVAHPDFLDVLYEDLVAESYRKRYGQFLTPTYVAEFMASWINSGKPKVVCDPAVGTGIFLDKIAQVAGSSRIELWGFDIDPIMLNAAKLRLAMRNIEGALIQLKQENFLKVGFPLKKYEGMICNPPYLNFHNFDRDHLIDVVEAKYGTKLSRLTNIYVLFFMQSLLFAKQGTRVAFITPSEFLYTGYGEDLKSFFLRYTTLDALVLADFEALVFRKALTTAIITLFRKEPPHPDHKVKFIRVTKWPTTSEMLDVVTGELESTEDYQIRYISQKDLDSQEKWTKHFGGTHHTELLQELMPLSKLADVNRGIATGHNEFFTLSEPQVKEWGIEKRFLVPVVSRTSQCKGYDFTREDWDRLRENNAKVFLLYCFEKPTKNLKNYLEYGKRLEADKRYLTRHRTPWYSMERREPARILATVFHRKRMRFVLNSANVRNLAAFHCVYPKHGDATTTKALLAYLNSNLCKEIQVTKRREYGGGLHKFEPSDLEKVPTLNVSRLSKGDIQTLASMFDKLCATFRRGADESHIRKELDDFLRSVTSERQRLDYQGY